jgi:hypothetical protein
MSTRKEREERAFEALIVSQLRKECDPAKVKPEDLPPLTDKEKAAIAAFGPNLVERLWNQEKKSAPPVPVQTGQVITGQFVMNRAREGSEQTKDELDRKRAQLLERMKQLHEEKKNGSDS